MDLVLGLFVNFILVIFVIILAFSSIKIIKQSTVGIVERLGKYHKSAEEGINVIIPFIDRFRAIVDLREQVVDFPPQPVITKDNVTMMIDTVVYYQVTDAFKYTYEIARPILAIENLTATTLRNIVGDLELDETLTSRDLVNTKLRTILDEATDKWGIKVNRVELKNILPPQDIQTAMEKQMRAEREKREAILRAEGQKTAAILEAEGQKQAAILNAEAVREAAIKEAEGMRQAQILRAEGEAQAILNVQKSVADSLVMIKEAGADNKVLAIKSLEALKEIGDGQSTKLIIPSDLAGLGGVFAALKEAVESKD
ncbi:SPFH domain-containing protein [Syntrophomonas wolfei]|uniref:SPFH domain, Band 7 family protein n=1 Tax=Syntrophomonas wolfei subsp. wolfei (strain DSM 2245B / Goettingen) TaxID=335541 RepID=Q0AVU3_SYNWW|nr:SPFH domain-containing protein [Syntrophomonas wolfei]ABI69161.1 SPFH domain, Band 7 family protein [Syntrophomonas wolfei subsp. wolfei str. Goettingen G311]